MIRRREGAADDSLRRLILAGQDVDYRLIRARRQSIGMTIDHTGLVVRAPRWVSIREIELALKERARWVIAMLAEWRGRNRDSLPSAWQDWQEFLTLSIQTACEVMPGPVPFGFLSEPGNSLAGGILSIEYQYMPG